MINDSKTFYMLYYPAVILILIGFGVGSALHQRRNNGVETLLKTKLEERMFRENS